MKKNSNNKFPSTFLKILLLGIPIILSIIILYFTITDKSYGLILLCLPLWILIIGLYFVLKNRDNNWKKLPEINESIKNYNEEIVINLDEYRRPYEIVVKAGKETTKEGKFLEINKSNELFKKGKHAVGTIVDIIDNVDYNITPDISRFEGDAFLVVEFINDEGKKYKVKTPAISRNLYNYIKVGQKVDVYYDDSVKKEAIYDLVYKNGKQEKQYYDNLDFYVTNIKGDIVSYKPIILASFAYIFILIIICILLYLFIK